MTTTYDYNVHGKLYSGRRTTDPGIEAQIHDALGDAMTVLNVGAGAGSYEPSDRTVIAVEPSAVMRSQRGVDKVPAVIATAAALPFDDKAFDASMAVLTIHHWSELDKGLLEMRRVTRDTVVIFTYDPAEVAGFWLMDYIPELAEVDRRRYPDLDFIMRTLGGQCEVRQVLVPVDCLDGFNEAYYARPEAFLHEAVRRSQSAWAFLPEGVEERVVRDIKSDLESGRWDELYGKHRLMSEYAGAIRLVCSRR